MKIINLVEVNSTHEYLKEYLETNTYSKPLCIVTKYQTNGIGSRGNSWNGKKGNLFFSFALKKTDLPKDLPLQSASIYFSYILKKELERLGSKIWLKWPNDFYINDKKIGGTITTVSKDLIMCGIGLNLLEVSKDFGYLDIKLDEKLLLKKYFNKLEQKISWKEIFSLFKIEFNQSKKYKTTVNNEKKSLLNAKLREDGSVEIDGIKVFSLR